MRTKLAIIIGMVLLLLGANLYGQAPDTLWTKISGQKSENMAVYLSVVSTIVPIGAGIALRTQEPEGLGAGLIISGLLIGPSAGHFYAQQWGQGFKTIGVRVGLGFGVLLTSATIASKFIDPTEDIISNVAAASCLAIAGVAVAAHGIYDITTTPKSVRKYNEKLNPELKPEINLRDQRYSLGLVYRF